MRHGVLPYFCNYDSSEPIEFEMLEKLQYMINERPEKALFMTTAKNDRVVGNWNVTEFFESFPVSPDHKYLIPSPQFGHNKVTQQQILAKNAFLRRYGSSYYKFPDEELNQGGQILDFAQKGRSVNIKEYIEYMENDDNEF